eukprot:3065699-Rhodomonas_salina.3
MGRSKETLCGGVQAKNLYVPYLSQISGLVSYPICYAHAVWCPVLRVHTAVLQDCDRKVRSRKRQLCWGKCARLLSRICRL